MYDSKTTKEIKEIVRDHYAKAVKPPANTDTPSYCSPQSQSIEFDKEAVKWISKMAGYTEEQLAGIPGTVTSFGCGNPVPFMKVKEGDVVLDLGSGTGLDLILAAKKVGTNGKVIGLDMTDEMIEVCRKNLDEVGIKNAEVRKGEMEKMPVQDGEVDWIISNCVINLSPDKQQVFSESYRVLKPGGQVMISDIVTNDLPDEYRNGISTWIGCFTGVVEEDEYLYLLKDAGFVDIKVVNKLVYDNSMLTSFVQNICSNCGEMEKSIIQAEVDKYADRVASVRVYAKKPLT